MAAKPPGSDCIPKILSTSRPVQLEHCTLRRDMIRMPSGVETEFHYLERAPAVIIVPVTSAGEVVLIRQYRNPVQEWCLETPAGGCHDTGSADFEEVARKELREEVGGEAGSLELLGSVYSSPAFADECCQVFVAWDTTLSHTPEREGTEAIETVCLAASLAVEKARAGEMKTGPCMLALLWAEPLLRERGFIQS